MPVPPGVGVLTGLSEPTLRDLVAKLRTEPWANPEVISQRPVPEPSIRSHCRRTALPNRQRYTIPRFPGSIDTKPNFRWAA